MGIFDLFKTKNNVVKVDYIHDQYNFLENARNIVKSAVLRNNDSLVILSDYELTQLRKVYEILINYHLNSNFLFVYIFGNNVKFNIKNITFNGLDEKYLSYFSDNSFPIKLFQEQESGVDLIKINVLSDLFNINDIEFIKKLDKASDFKTAVSEYNLKNIGNNFSKEDSLFLLGVKKEYTYSELMKFDFFKNSIYSIIYSYVDSRFDETEYIQKLSDKMIHTLNTYYKYKIPLTEIFMFLQGLNNSELLEYVFNLAKILDSSEFIMLTQESKNAIVEDQFTKISNKIKENIKNIEDNNLTTINNLLKDI